MLKSTSDLIAEFRKVSDVTDVEAFGGVLMVSDEHDEQLTTRLESIATHSYGLLKNVLELLPSHLSQEINKRKEQRDPNLAEYSKFEDTYFEIFRECIGREANEEETVSIVMIANQSHDAALAIAMLEAVRYQ